jgi:hypothetical protein
VVGTDEIPEEDAVLNDLRNTFPPLMETEGGSFEPEPVENDWE